MRSMGSVWTLACLLLAAQPAGGYVRKVGSAGDFVTITNAVAASVDKDVILVSTGYYSEAVSIIDRDITIEGGYNSNCTAKIPGAKSIILAPTDDVSVMYITNSGVTLVDLTLSDGRRAAAPGNALYGAGLHVDDGCVVFVIGCVIESNEGRGNGGGIFARNSLLMLTNTWVRNNDTINGTIEKGRGGGIYCQGGELILRDGVRVTGNVAEASGGGICAVMGAFCRVRAATAEISGNRADEGGGIAAANASRVAIDSGAKVHGNIAGSRGGGLLLTGGSTGILSGSETFIGYNLPGAYSGNAVTNEGAGCGGGAAVLDSWIEVSQGASIRCNTAAESGGGIFLSNAVCLIDGATVGWTGNQTNGAMFGGGIYGENGSKVILTNGALVLQGAAHNNGGGICGYAQCDVRIYSSTVSTCSARSGDGGGLYLNACSLTGVNMRVDTSSATNGGGGAICGSFAYGWLTNLTVTRNGALDGGGVWWWGGTLRLTDSMIVSNGAQIGGAMFLRAANTALTRLLASENFSILDGGALFLTNAVVTVSNSVFRRNYADRDEDNVGDGGAIWAGGSRLTFRDINSDGSSFFRNGADYGAGLYAEDSTVRVEAASGAWTMGGNIALRSGGAVYLSRSSLIVTGQMSFVTNWAVLDGGALGASQSWVRVVTPTNTEASLFYANDCWRSGGALYGAASTVQFDRVWLWQNTASNHGGAMRFDGGAAVGFREVLATDNASGHSGGAMALFAGSTLGATNCVLSDNRAEQYGGGLYLAPGSRAWFVSPDDDAHRIDFNRALFGGGIAAETGAYFYADDNLALSRNDAGDHGGGLYARAATAELRRAYVRWNSATNTGGGIWAIESSVIDLQDSLLAGNTIGQTTGGGGLRLSDSTARASECTIVSNVGAGIYVAFARASSATVISSIVYGNTPGNIQTGQVVSYSCVEGGYTGTANFDAPPRLYPRNFHLTHASPCRGQGGFVSPTDVDVDGELRGAGFSDCGFDEFVDGDQDLLPDVVETGTGVWNGEEDTGSDPANADSDHDGMPDGEEWIADTDPNDTNDSLRVTALWHTAATTRVEWVGGTAAIQRLQSCGDGFMTNWNTEQIFHPPTPPTNAWSWSGTSNRIIFRMTAERP